jgi:cytochrome c oxidase assembly protein subunit 15
MMARLNSKMTVEEFKSIYYYEWAHRNLGRFLGAAYTLPLLYFTARGHVRGPLRTRLYAIAAGIGFQVRPPRPLVPLAPIICV